jgi:hypothetical protein
MEAGAAEEQRALPVRGKAEEVIQESLTLQQSAELAEVVLEVAHRLPEAMARLPRAVTAALAISRRQLAAWRETARAVPEREPETEKWGLHPARVAAVAMVFPVALGVWAVPVLSDKSGILLTVQAAVAVVRGIVMHSQVDAAAFMAAVAGVAPQIILLRTDEERMASLSLPIGHLRR